MSLDTKYRPTRYADLLGQETIIKILKAYVAKGQGYRQSYLFCGGYGSGKTTTARILARALLCDSPIDGEPCDQCSSCKAMLAGGSDGSFIEVDAATHSSVSEIQKFTENLKYQHISGKRQLILFDEAHQLSKDALDALLKPMEDNLPGSQDKLLTCIFCTTEPERMRATVLSRCAPAFQIEPQSPKVIAKRLAYVCNKENLAHDDEALTLIAEYCDGHIRDALKAIEGVYMLGPLTPDRVAQYLHLDVNNNYLELLVEVGQDLNESLRLAQKLLEKNSPATCYAKLSEAAMMAFKISIGDKPRSYWNADKLKVVGQKGTQLLDFAAFLAARPNKPSGNMFLCDVALLHHGRLGQQTATTIVREAAPAQQVLSTEVFAAALVSGVGAIYAKPIQDHANKTEEAAPPNEVIMTDAQLQDISVYGVNEKITAKSSKTEPSSRWIDQQRVTDNQKLVNAAQSQFESEIGGPKNNPP